MTLSADPAHINFYAVPSHDYSGNKQNIFFRKKSNPEKHI